MYRFEIRTIDDVTSLARVLERRATSLMEVDIVLQGLEAEYAARLGQEIVDSHRACGCTAGTVTGLAGAALSGIYVGGGAGPWVIGLIAGGLTGKGLAILYAQAKLRLILRRLTTVATGACNR